MISERKNAVPSVFGYSVMNVSTQSMLPNYKPGDLIAVKKVEVDTLKENDVISFFSIDPDIYGLPNTHRIVKIENDGEKPVFTTKGDNNPSADIYKVSSENVIGKVMYKVPFLGKAIYYLQTTRSAYFLVIILPLLVITIFEIRNLARKLRKAENVDESENE